MRGPASWSAEMSYYYECESYRKANIDECFLSDNVRYSSSRESTILFRLYVYHSNELAQKRKLCVEKERR